MRKCVQCGNLFYAYTYLNHSKIEHIYPCDKCRYKFTTKKALAEHAKKHDMFNDFKCKECHLIFDNQHQFIDHVGEKHSYVCRICNDFKSTTYDVLSKHFKQYHPEYTFRCSRCGRTFQTIANYYKHAINEHPKVTSSVFYEHYPKGTSSSSSSSSALVPDEESFQQPIPENVEELYQSTPGMFSASSAPLDPEHPDPLHDNVNTVIYNDNVTLDDLFHNADDPNEIGDRIVYTCPNCGSEFNHRIELNRHSRIYHGRNQKCIIS